MKSDPAHVLIRHWTRLAREIEQTFSYIERERRVLAAVINGAIAGTSVALIAWLVTELEQGDVLLFACLGSSAASLVFAPLSRFNSLRTIILAYVIASLTCVGLFPIYQHGLLPLPLQFFLAVTIPVTVMRLVDCMHPAAIGGALAFVIYERSLHSLLVLLPAIIGLLTIVKALTYVYRDELDFRHFGNEFRRRYYGREVTVTVASTGHDDTDHRDADRERAGNEADVDS
jgi:CBS-domain-containing membrane protein